MNTTQPETHAVAVRNIDDITLAAQEAFAGAESFAKELQVARSIADLRAALTPAIMADVMALMNTSLGFRTDKDPNQIDRKTGKPHVPYSIDVVKDVFIESRLRGFHAINNEFNIIAGRFYGCVSGFERKVRSHPKVTDFKDHFEVPRFNTDKTGAIVKSRGDWKQDGQPQFLERDFAVKVNDGMGVDAVIGKAKRKLYSAVYSRLSGVVTPDGDIDEPAERAAQGAVPTQTATASTLFTKPATAEAPVPVETPAHTDKPEAVKPASVYETPALELVRFMRECSVSFEDFRDFVSTKGLLKDADSYASWEQLPITFCADFKTNHAKAMTELIKKFGKVQGK